MTTHRSVTDGLALVAYAATARLQGRPARYAWTVVVTVAGLSGLAQAAYLAGGGGPAQVAPALRFGVGAWPAIAAAVVAHLLHLLATAGDVTVEPGQSVHPESRVQPVQPELLNTTPVQPWSATGDVHCERDVVPEDEPQGSPTAGPPARALPSPARDRAEAVATRHVQRVGVWPTVSELVSAAEVSRGTAAAALKSLRDRPLPLHLINTGRDDHDEAQS